MRISLIQSALHWEEKAKNLEMFAEKLLPLVGQTDLVVLPEMFSTGFSMQTEKLAEPLHGPTFQWMQTQASTLKAAIVGSFICEEEGQYYNRLVWMMPDGAFHFYDKRHLFTNAGEPEHFTAGKSRKIIEYMGFRICPMICYDLRFPVWSRNNDAYDVLIFVANWPVTRIQHWDALLMARAIENQAFTIGVNIFGMDGKDLKYSGHSALIDYVGRLLHQINDKEGIISAEISIENLRNYRNRFTFLKDQDIFEINL
jgi:omega-amidase